MPGVSVVGLVDLQIEAAERRQAEYQLTAARVGTDLNEMLRALQPDVVFDCTIPAARVSVVLSALRHGCHVLSEKPLAPSMADGRRLLRAAEKSGRLFAVMQNRRFDGRIRAVRDFLSREEIGGVTTVNSDFYLGPHFGGFREQMRHVLLLDMAIHSFDQARLLSGGDAVAVYCREWNPAGSWYGHGASAVAIFEMSNGIVYTYRGSWSAEGLPTTWECDWRIIGSRGTVTWNGNNEIRAQKTAGEAGFIRPVDDVTVTLPPQAESSGHALCIAEFLHGVRAGKTPETICTDNIKSLAMVFAAIKSAQTGRRVSIKI